VSKTPEELSLICPRYLSIQSEKNSPNWKCLKVAGPLDFNLTGILNGLSDTLALAKISIFDDFDIWHRLPFVTKTSIENCQNCTQTCRIWVWI